MRRWLLLILLLVLSGAPAVLQAENITAPLAVPGQQNQPAPVLGPDQIYDITGPVPLPESRRPFLLLAAAGLALLLLIGLMVFFLRKKRSRQRQAVLSAHETALLQLAQAERLIAAQDIAAFVNLIDQTLRRYIEERFAISAPRQTSREFISRIAEEREDVPDELKAHSENLKIWLQHCDLVKFASAALSRESMTEMATNLRRFIEATQPETERK